MVKWENRRLSYIASLLLMLTFSFAQAQEEDAINGDPNKGKELFNTNCAACHKLDQKVIGPALGGIVERLKEEQNLGRDWLHSWIKDNAALRASGDAYAQQVYEENNKVAMTPFPNLSEKDIDDILAFTSNPPADEPEPEVAAAPAGGEQEQGGVMAGMLIIGFAILAALLIWMLFKVNKLNKLTLQESPIGDEHLQQLTFKETLEKYSKYAGPVLGVLALLALYGVWNALLGVGVDQGYQPEQPIYFSHKIHAGEQGIDCQMCHTSAKYGKVSGIPTTNVCMNCHYQIQEYKGSYVEEGKSKEFYTQEIQKIYASSGFDKNSMEYTGDQIPIEWVRIHNMPDFVYFSHAQHVVAGGEAIKASKNVEQVCYACHGRVDEMNEVKMANKFTMGWCIECHRETQVDMSNGYNEQYYAQLHEKLKQQYGDEATITVDAIGGLECGKCHY